MICYRRLQLEPVLVCAPRERCAPKRRSAEHEEQDWFLGAGGMSFAGGLGSIHRLFEQLRRDGPFGRRGVGRRRRARSGRRGRVRRHASGHAHDPRQRRVARTRPHEHRERRDVRRRPAHTRHERHHVLHAERRLPPHLPAGHRPRRRADMDTHDEQGAVRERLRHGHGSAYALRARSVQYPLLRRRRADRRRAHQREGVHLGDAGRAFRAGAEHAA